METNSTTKSEFEAGTPEQFDRACRMARQAAEQTGVTFAVYQDKQGDWQVNCAVCMSESEKANVKVFYGPRTEGQ
jgi:hypothetical protein